MENHTVTPDKTNTLTHPESLKAIDLQQMESLRAERAKAFDNAQFTAISKGESFDDADAEGRAAADRVVRERVGDFSNENTPLTAIIEKYAAFDDARWYTAERDIEGNVITPSGIDQFRRDVAALEVEPVNEASEEAGTLPFPVELPPLPDIDPQHAALRHEVADLRSELATLSAKRQGFIAGRGGEQYADALSAYNEKVVALGKLELQEELSNELLTDTDKNALAVSFIFGEQQRLREQTKEKLAGTPVGKFVEFMNRGNKVVRLAKGVGLGVAAAGAGAAIGALAGVAGVAALGAGVAAGATAAVRFGRGFARADAKYGRGLQDLTDTHAVEAQATVTANETRLESINQYFTETLEKDTKNEQSKRRKAVAWGLGGIALGTAAGVAVQFIADANVFDGKLNRPGGIYEAPAPAAPEAPEVPEVEAPPVEEAPAEPPVPEIVADPNFAIEGGEGGIHFFQSLGLSEADWYAVSGELRQNFPNEFYTEGYDVRIAHPGQLSLEAQQFIKTRFGL